MVYATYTASQAVTRARAVSSWQTAMCLNYVFHCVTEVSAGLYDANAAWSAATQKVTTGTPPAGAPVYFRGGSHGHIAISVGGGRIRSTDWKSGYGTSLGSVGECSINDLAVEWFGTVDAYRGWSRDYAGQIIRGLEETNSNYSPPPVIPAPLKEDPMPTIAEILAAPIVSPTDGKAYTFESWLTGANVKAGQANAAASQALAKVNALGDRQSLINDVTDAVLNAPVPNHDEDPSDNVPPDSFAFRSYPVMANWRASQLQGEVADVKAQLSETSATLATVLKALSDLSTKVDTLPKG